MSSFAAVAMAPHVIDPLHAPTSLRGPGAGIGETGGGVIASPGYLRDAHPPRDARSDGPQVESGAARQAKFFGELRARLIRRARRQARVERSG